MNIQREKGDQKFAYFVSQMDHAIQQNAAPVEQASTAAQAMAQETSGFYEVVDIFLVRN
jgi:methyl-accepting chemotaxis protein